SFRFFLPSGKFALRGVRNLLRSGMENRKEKIPENFNALEVVETAREMSRLKPIKDISSETGLSVTWLKKFRRGVIVNPPLAKVAKIYLYFGFTLNVGKVRP